MPRLLSPFAFFRRGRRIAAALTRHGLGFLVVEIGLRRYVPFRRSFATRRPAPSTRGRHLRQALEEMGATFVKLGQILSTRPDLVPADIASELTRLQDDAPPEPWERVREVLERELGRPVDAAFAELDPVPVAAASIGQVHRGRLADGSPVAVKVRRPGIEEEVATDLAVLRRLAAAAARSSLLAPYEPVEVMEEFARTLWAELDYVRERRNLERYGRDLLQEPGVRAPKTYPAWSTREVLTMEYVDGIRVDDLDGLERLGVDRAELARRLASVLFRSALERGFFHCDPHPGNCFVLPDGEVAILDFGMMAYFSPQERDHLVEVLLAIVDNDPELATDRLLDLGLKARAGAARRLQRELGLLLYDYTGLPLKDLPMGEILLRIVDLVRSLQLRLPAQLAMLIKTLVMAEGLGQRLDPDFEMIPLARRLVRRALVRRFRPRRLRERARRGALDALAMAEETPRRLRRLAERVERGDLEVEINVDQRYFIYEMERIARSLKLSAMAASGILALGILTLAHRPPGWERWVDWLFVAGVVTTLGLVAFLLVDLWRRKGP